MKEKLITETKYGDLLRECDDFESIVRLAELLEILAEIIAYDAMNKHDLKESL